MSGIFGKVGRLAACAAVVDTFRLALRMASPSTICRRIVLNMFVFLPFQVIAAAVLVGPPAMELLDGLAHLVGEAAFIAGRVVGGDGEVVRDADREIAQLEGGRVADVDRRAVGS